MSDRRVLSDIEIEQIPDGISKLYCAGYVEYQDGRGAIRKTAFCTVLQPSKRLCDGGRFKQITDDTDYAYED